MVDESLRNTCDTKKIVIIANFATDRVNGAYNVIENIAVYTNKLGYSCELWGLSTELDQNNYPFYVHFKANLHHFTVPEDLKNKLIWDRDSIICVNLHSVFTPINIGLSKLVKALNIQLCVTPQGGYHDYTFKRNYLKKKIFLFLYEKAYLKQIDYFFIHGSQEENFIKKYSSKPCYTLLNGFPEGKISSSIYDHQNAGPHQKLKLLFMGRLDPLHKGLDLLIKSMTYLKDAEVELTLIGPQFTEEAQRYLHQLITKLNLTASVTIKAPVYKQTEKEELYTAHQLFVHTSRWEGMPTGVIEALSYGMPVLISKGTNLAEIVKKEQFGWVIDELTPAGIATVIADVCNNKEKLNEFSENAYTQSPQTFNWNKIAKKYVTCILLNR
ncbi:Glycosyltransferase involved in cell wall bisynthesis [Mucilaginibacter mallensis]|uniref:Glycosyltransferase involved in cell wall bisynthesis n=1 Tax=Mucilaginibacter mallensis TaxID=652787 RepID=A0A1H2C420_MUCMA|nr:glycosyltransferase family 4 protein [Mucilaginibacter mallensis]SDT65072.1 Glycosyltransferase involved in cell wall bisynthesis [Mucilaginibacter mallensis]